MLINFCSSSQFRTGLQLNNNFLDHVKETTLLGVIISDDLSWSSNTNSLVKRAYQRMTILRNLYTFNVSDEDLVKIYILFIRSVVEQSCVVWASSITKEEEYSLERTQKCALRIIFKGRYQTYTHALKLSKLSTLSARRSQLQYNFAVKCTRNDKTKDMFPLNPSQSITRNPEKYLVPFAHTDRLAKSAILSMARQLNEKSNT